MVQCVPRDCTSLEQVDTSSAEPVVCASLLAEVMCDLGRITNSEERGIHCVAETKPAEVICAKIQRNGSNGIDAKRVQQ